MENTKIEWATHTFNPWIGCSKVHAGCLNCYAETLMADRYKTVVWGPHGTRKLTSPAKWREPVRWNKAALLDHATRIGPTERPRVFCASLADVFEDWDGPIMDSRAERLCRCGACDLVVAYGGECKGCGRADANWPWLTMDDARRRLFALIDATPNLDWLILTKRPENIRRMMPERRDNVWLLTSVSNQETYEKQWPELVKCRDLSPVLGLSVEPQLGPIDLMGKCLDCEGGGQVMRCEGGRPYEGPCDRCNGTGWGDGKEAPDWIIAGGESGRDARPCAVEWVDDLRSQACLAAIPFFAKQLGAKPVTTNANLYDFEEVIRTEEWGTAAASCRYVLDDPKGGDWDEWPESLRVREFPQVTHEP